MKKEFWIGSYAMKGMSALQRACLDTDAGRLHVMPVSAEAENPSWVLPHPNGQILYTVEERVPDGGLAVFSLKEGKATMIRRLNAGSAPCHLAMDSAAEFLFVSNYMDGTLDVWMLDAEGVPQQRTDHIVHHGRGPNPVRQEGPHIHASLVLDDYVCCTDLGLDAVFVYRLKRHDGSLTEIQRISFPAGCGPRHMAFHPDYPDCIFVNAEMGGGVYVVRRSDGSILQEVRAIPEDFADSFRVSAIRFAGNTLYLSSRECNVVIMFELKPDGLLSERAIYHHHQETPRDVWMDEAWGITADEGSEGLTLFKRESNRLTEVGFISIPGIRPTCIMPVI